MANASLQATAQRHPDTPRSPVPRRPRINLGGRPAGTSASGIPRVHGPQAIEYVIRRGGSQMGVPYSWGGGSLTGPSKGIDDGAKIVASTVRA